MKDIDSRDYLEDLKEIEDVLNSWVVHERYGKAKYESTAYHVRRVIKKIEKERQYE